MNGKKLLVSMALCLATVQPVASQAPSTSRGSMALPVDPQLLNDLPELKGVVSWRVLAQVKTGQSGAKPVPEFSPEIQKLDKQEVRVQGYMLPIVAGETHDHFLLSMRPPHCPFCLSLGAEYIVEVKSRSPIKHTYEPVVVAGRLNVLRDDPFGLYYRLTEAQISAANR
ncbi:MAG: DUF3299 domain-containing protein [Burkholderiaceae bacterium]